MVYDALVDPKDFKRADRWADARLTKHVGWGG